MPLRNGQGCGVIEVTSLVALWAHDLPGANTSKLVVPYVHVGAPCPCEVAEAVESVGPKNGLMMTYTLTFHKSANHKTPRHYITMQHEQTTMLSSTAHCFIPINVQVFGQEQFRNCHAIARGNKQS